MIKVLCQIGWGKPELKNTGENGQHEVMSPKWGCRRAGQLPAPLQLCGGLDQALSSITGLKHCTHLQLFPLAVSLLNLSLASTAMCLWGDPAATVMHANNQCTHSSPWTLLPVLAPTTMCVSATSPCHHTGTCSWPLQPSMCTSLAPATTVDCRFLRAGPKSNTEHPDSPAAAANQPTVLTKDHRIVNAVDLRSLTQRHSAPSDLVATTHACTWHPATLDPGSQHIPAHPTCR